MTAEYVATVILSVYSNGHVKTGAKKLEYEDFLQMVYMAKGELLRARYEQDKLQGDVYNITSLLEEYVLDVKMVRGNERRVDFPVDVVDLPGDIGVFTISPAFENHVSYCSPLSRVRPGAEWLYCGEGDIASFVPYSKYAKIFNLDSCVKKAHVRLIGNSEESEVPFDLAWGIAKEIWRQVFRTITLPIDKTADNNPNAIEEIIKAKLSSPQIR
jgi:hypothetical protein